MKVVQLDSRKMDTVLHSIRYLKKQLNLPDAYGEDLKALQELLAKCEEETLIVFHHSYRLKSLGEYQDHLQMVLKAAQDQNNRFHFIYR